LHCGLAWHRRQQAPALASVLLASTGPCRLLLGSTVHCACCCCAAPPLLGAGLGADGDGEGEGEGEGEGGGGEAGDGGGDGEGEGEGEGDGDGARAAPRPATVPAVRPEALRVQPEGALRKQHPGQRFASPHTLHKKGNRKGVVWVGALAVCRGRVSMPAARQPGPSFKAGTQPTGSAPRGAAHQAPQSERAAHLAQQAAGEGVRRAGPSSWRSSGRSPPSRSVPGR
jgi:hypothetical protein